MEASQMTSELEALKTKLRATWIAGDFGEIARSYATGAEEFVRDLNLQPGMRVLDVACGSRAALDQTQSCDRSHD